MKQYYVYMMSRPTRTLYIGVTNDIQRRVWEHKQQQVPGFTSKYHLTMLVYYEMTDDVRGAIAREKQLKGWLRAKKVALIDSINPEWDDLSAGWYIAPQAIEGPPILHCVQNDRLSSFMAQSE